MIRQVNKGRLLEGSAVGALLAAAGLVGWIYSGSLIYISMHLIGFILFLEFILLAYQIKPNPINKYHYFLHLVAIILLGTITGIFFFDFPGLFIFKLWEYPIYSPLTNPYGYLFVSIE